MCQMLCLFTDISLVRSPIIFFSLASLRSHLDLAACWKSLCCNASKLPWQKCRFTKEIHPSKQNLCFPFCLLFLCYLLSNCKERDEQYKLYLVQTTCQICPELIGIPRGRSCYIHTVLLCSEMLQALIANNTCEEQRKSIQTFHVRYARIYA